MLDLSLGSSIYTDNIWEAAIQELDILFNTTNTELIGYPEYGTNFEQFLWTLTPMKTELQRYIEEKLSGTFFLKMLRYHIEVDTYIDESACENVYVVKITLYDDYNSLDRTYKLNDLIEK